MKQALENWLTKKLTTPDLEDFLKKHRSDKKALVVNCNDSPYQDFFPHRIRVDDAGEHGAQKVDYYNMPFEDEEFDVVLCTGLLEHLEDPWAATNEMKRVLKKGGQILIGASWAFSMHDAPHNYYHFTPIGMEHLLKKGGWKNIKSKGSCKPMKTIGILLQRIAFQTGGSKIMRILLFLAAKPMPFFDRFIGQEYGGIKHEYKVDNMLSSNVHASAEK